MDFCAIAVQSNSMRLFFSLQPQRGIEMGMVIVIVKLNHHAFF